MTKTRFAEDEAMIDEEIVSLVHGSSLDLVFLQMLKQLLLLYQHDEPLSLSDNGQAISLRKKVPVTCAPASSRKHGYGEAAQ